MLGGVEPVDVLGVVVVGVEDVGVDEVVLVAVVVTVGFTVGAQDSDALLTGPVPGGSSDDTGVPGATFTVKDSVCPLSSVTSTVH